MILNYAVASDRGLVRQNNEDSAYAGPHLIALADGMGGHAAGEVASQLMINHIKKLDVDPVAADLDMLAVLGSIADEGNRAIAAEVRRNPETDGMGTTLTALMFDGSQFGMCHVGDSRGYRLRDGKLEQITVDDTFVQSLVNQGKLDPEDVSTHPQRSLILKAYTGRPVEPTLVALDAKPGDRLLLCSDGLSDPVTHATIEQTLCEGTPLQAARRLIELALRSGGPDNVTVVIADVVEVEKNDQGLSVDAQGNEVSTVPVTAGALNADEPEDPRPDTAAGRAAMMAAAARTPKVIGPKNETFAGIEPAASAEEASTGKKKAWFALVTAIVVVAALVGGGWYGYQAADKHYFIATQDDAIVIEHGVDYRVFGRDLHEPYLWACLDKDGNLKTTEQRDSSCHLFSLKDLPPTGRDAIAGLSGGSLDEMIERVHSLATQALPVCVQRKNVEGDAVTTPDSQKGAGDLTSPGVNCREV